MAGAAFTFEIQEIVHGQTPMVLEIIPAMVGVADNIQMVHAILQAKYWAHSTDRDVTLWWKSHDQELLIWHSAYQ